MATTTQGAGSGAARRARSTEVDDLAAVARRLTSGLTVATFADTCLPFLRAPLSTRVSRVSHRTKRRTKNSSPPLRRRPYDRTQRKPALSQTRQSSGSRAPRSHNHAPRKHNLGLAKLGSLHFPIFGFLGHTKPPFVRAPTGLFAGVTRRDTPRSR